MSSWIPSLFNPFTDDGGSPPPNDAAPRSPTSGVKDDISAVFRGVAAFLAPAAPSSSSERIEGIKHDLAEIQGSFRWGLSLISSKIASNLVQLQSQLDGGGGGGEDGDEEEDGVGINEEVLDFVRRISGRPELWTDFPLSLPDDFDLSDYQEEHAASIDDFIPEFVTLRQKICSQMSLGKFWFIYFILLLPRLNEDDFKLLVTPQVAEARETLLKKLQNKTEADQENPEPSDTNKDNKKGSEGGESPSQHKDVLPPVTVKPNEQREDDVSETESVHHDQKQSENKEEVSFSDLEDDDDDDAISNKPSSSSKASTSDKTNFVKPNENSEAPRERESSEGEESNDWLTVDDTDFDNLAAV